jgi:GTP-binding protein
MASFFIILGYNSAKSNNIIILLGVIVRIEVWKMKVAIVGRPNVGKSSLFNAFTRTRDALVHDRPGITRDVISGRRGDVTFLDTAGLESGGGIVRDSTNFALAAAAQADVVLFVVDGRTGLHLMDLEWARRIKKSGSAARVFLVANKCESAKGLSNLHEFYKLGFGEPFPVSAEHNIGLNDVIEGLGGMPGAAPDVESFSIRVAVVGQPNVGKSTLINHILGERRVLVADRPGVTRDVVRVSTHYLGRDIQIADTAGLRRKSKVDDGIETLAALKSLDALEDADVVILMIDATKSIEKQAVQIAARIYDAGKNLVVALNTWDIVPQDSRYDRLLRLKHAFKDSHHQILSPVILPISAERGVGIKNMMRRVYGLVDKSNAHAPTSLVNRVVEKLMAEKQPPMSRIGRPMKIKFASHTGFRPNVITINVGGASDIPESYARYLRRGISERLGWESLPVVVRFAKEDNPFG